MAVARAGMSLCRPMGDGPGEVQTDRPSDEIVFTRGHLVALHAFIKMTRTTPDDDLAVARKRQKELPR